MQSSEFEHMHTLLRGLMNVQQARNRKSFLCLFFCKYGYEKVVSGLTLGSCA